MATGAAAPFQRFAHTPGNPQLPVLPDPAADKTGLDDPFLNGASVEVARFDERVLEVLGAGPGVANGFAQFYLDGIGGTPNPVDFGNITAAKQRIVTVHNTHRFAVSITALDLSAISGVTLLSPGLPVVVAPFSSQVFLLEASLDGIPDFDGLAVFTHDVPGSFTIRMLGRRVIIFDVMPQSKITEQLRFKTDLMISEDGTEQAMSLRIAPRSQVSLFVRETDNVKRTTLMNLQMGAGFLPQGVQLWWQSRELTSAALTTDTVLQVVTADMEIADGDTLSLVLPDTSTLEVEVLSFTASDITLTQAVGTALPLGTSLMPIRFGFQSARQTHATFPLNVQDMKTDLTLLDYINIGAVDGAYFDTHPTDGLPIHKAPLFLAGASRKSGMNSFTTRLDSETGTMRQSRTEPLSRPGSQILVHINSYADQHAWRKFLHFIRGSWGAWYVPTNTNDLPLALDFTLGGNTFEIPSMGVESLLGNVAPRRDVKLQFNGLTFYRRIASVVDNGTTEVVTLDSVIPGAGLIVPADMVISWLELVRLASDVATFKHMRRGTAELRFSVRGVIDGV